MYALLLHAMSQGKRPVKNLQVSVRHCLNGLYSSSSCGVVDSDYTQTVRFGKEVDHIAAVQQ